MRIITYDFDKTVYDGDSSINFYKYCLKRKPSILKYIPIQLYATIMHYGLKKWPKVKMKEKYFMFFKDIPDIEEWVNDFWQINACKLKDWYIKRNHSEDVIISASPEFLLKPICKEIGVKALIGSKVDPKTGKFDGDNCYGQEKVARLNQYMTNYEMSEFYSDSLSDTPLAVLAEKSYIVIGDKLINWEEYVSKHK